MMDLVTDLKYRRWRCTRIPKSTHTFSNETTIRPGSSGSRNTTHPFLASCRRILKCCHAHIQTSKAFTRAALHGVQESFTFERFGRTHYSFIRLASTISFTSIHMEDCNRRKIYGLKK